MNNWLAWLNGNPIDWLLEPDESNPGVRYFALRDLLDKPTQDADVSRARHRIMVSGPVPAILNAQSTEGYWVKPGAGYSPSYRSTVWQIMFLAELGADPADERVRRGCEYLLGHAIAKNGAFSMGPRPVPSSAVLCLNGDVLAALIWLGFGTDIRTQIALNWQAAAISAEEPVRYYKSGTSGPGFRCAYNQGQPCAWGAIKALKAFLSIPSEQRSPLVEHAMRAGVDLLLSRNPAVSDYPSSDRVSSAWFRFGFPLSYRSDVLETVEVLTSLGYEHDPRLADAQRFILSKQDSQGRWLLEATLNGKMWLDIEQKGKPSKWVTLRALRVLKNMMLSAVRAG